MMMVTNQSCKQHPTIFPLATLGGEAAASGTLFLPSWVLSITLMLHSTINHEYMEKMIKMQQKGGAGAAPPTVKKAPQVVTIA